MPIFIMDKDHRSLSLIFWKYWNNRIFLGIFYFFKYNKVLYGYNISRSQIASSTPRGMV